MLINTLLLPFAAGASTSSSDTSPRPTLISEDTRSYLNAALARWGVPGTAGVVVAGPAYTGGEWATEYYSYGVADSQGHGVTEETLFSIGSNTKLFTALSVFSLLGNVTEHVLTPDSKLKDILPDWGLMDTTASENANITDIASMLSGVPGHGIAVGPQSDAESVARMRHLKPSAPLRTAFQYSNWHYRVLAEVVSVVSGTPFVDWVGANILAPLGMKYTTFNYTGLVKADGFSHAGINITQCVASPDVEHLQGCVGTPVAFGWWNPAPWDGSGAGEGGLVSNARDMGKWFKELLSPQVLPTLAIQLAVTPRVLINPPAHEMGPWLYGAGQMVSSYRNHTVYMHNGQRPGHASLFVRLPEKELAVGLLANEDTYSALAPMSLQLALVGRILDALLGVEPAPAEERVLAQLKALAGAGSGAGTQASTRPQAAAGQQPAAGPGGGADGAGGAGALGGGTAVPTPAPSPAQGAWSNPAYGNFTFAPLPPGDMNTTEGALAAGVAALGQDPATALWAVYDGYISHLTAAHFDGPLWNITAWTVYQHDGQVIVPGGQPFVGVITGEGMGWWGVNGAGVGVNATPPMVEDLEGTAEVFFVRP